jgi:UDP-2,3-diacylglucosamine hydrolase
MKIIFISDLHLSPETEYSNQLFYKLLAKWQNEIDALYILGDFFDYWVGDDDDNSFTQEIKNHLKAFTKSTPIYFIRGNHDFGIGKKLALQTGIKLLADCHILTINNQRILLSHGDRFCTLDIKYQRMKKILQNPILIALLRLTPLSWRYKLKNILEHKTSKSVLPKNSPIYNVTEEALTQASQNYKVDVIIHGHTHNPGLYNLNNLSLSKPVLRIEIPDWLERTPGGYVYLHDGRFDICS